MIDNIAFVVNLSGGQLIHAQVQVDDDDTRQALQRFLGLWSFDDMNMIAEGVAERFTVGLDMQEMTYPEDDSGMVEVGDGMEFTTALSETEFDRLMLKLFDTLIQAVNENPTDFSSGDEWDEFISYAETVRSRI